MPTTLHDTVCAVKVGERTEGPNMQGMMPPLVAPIPLRPSNYSFPPQPSGRLLLPNIIYFNRGLVRHKRGYTTDLDANEWTTSLASAARQLECMYIPSFIDFRFARPRDVRLSRPQATSIDAMLAVASRSVEAAILRNPHNPVDCQSLPALSGIVSESSATSGSPSSWTPPEDPLTRLVDNALNGCSAPLLSEVTPSFDDLPEIPDEDTLDQRVLEPINDARPPSIQSSTPSTEQASKPTTRIVSEKPMRNARGLVKQYRSYKRKAQPCAMGRTSLPTVLEDQDWESSAALPAFVRVYKRKKGKKAKRSKRVRQDGIENGENVQPAEGAQLLNGKDIQSSIPFI